MNSWFVILSEAKNLALSGADARSFAALRMTGQFSYH